MSIAIVPGSFDPMTLGHLALIREAASRYDRVVVAVMVNSEKKYLFDMPTRVEMATLTLGELSNVEVIGDEGMLIDLYDRIGADAVVKSYRNNKDLAYEKEMADWNRAHNPRFRTELIAASGEHSTVSSTEVRALLSMGKLPTDLVHPAILPFLERMKLNMQGELQ